MTIRFALNKKYQKVVEEQAVWHGTNCYVKISQIGLKVSSICTVQQYPNAVFFIHFAAAEPSINICVGNGTQYNGPSVYIAITAQNCGCEFRPRQFRSVSAEPLTATRGTYRFRGTTVEKHCPNVIKFHEGKLKPV